MSDDELIADWIARNGVTRCPVAFAEPSQAAVNPVDAAVHAERHKAPRETMQKKVQRGWNLYWRRRRLAQAAERARKQ